MSTYVLVGYRPHETFPSSPKFPNGETFTDDLKTACDRALLLFRAGVYRTIHVAVSIPNPHGCRSRIVYELPQSSPQYDLPVKDGEEICA